MDKHTPGPLSFCDSRYDDPQITALPFEVFTPGGFSTAACRREEDARLYSAAPDLLATATRYVAAVKALGTRSKIDPGCNLFDERPMSDAGITAWRELNDAGKELSAAIAKATGAAE